MQRWLKRSVQYLRAAPLALALVGVGGSLYSSGCKDFDEPNRVYACPSRDIFVRYVSPVMEKRCGTLDCHGSAFRPMRLYGETGLRHPAENNRSGGAITTPVELQANYLSICSIEPEKMDEVAVNPGGQSASRLLMVRKARGQEGHKGGQVFHPFDDADLCVVGWLRGDAEVSVAEGCGKALDRLP